MSLVFELDPKDQSKIKRYNYKLKHNVTVAAFEEAHEAFGGEYYSLKQVKSRVAELAALSSTYYDTCPDSCVCFVGPYAEDTVCPFCKQPRFNEQGKARSRFLYIHLIPRLQALFFHPTSKHKVMYRSQYTKDNQQSESICDVFDGDVYKTLLEKEIEVEGKKIGVKYFADERDIALAFTSDRFCPHDNRSATC